ncbi:MAG: hypothetical protein R3C09_15020 [Pirellulaceae bacterium]
MFLVNYFGSYAVCPQVLRHTHDYRSYADTIMPHFLFAVGFALRLTFGRRVERKDGGCVRANGATTAGIDPGVLGGLHRRPGRPRTGSSSTDWLLGSDWRTTSNATGFKR